MMNKQRQRAKVYYMHNHTPSLEDMLDSEGVNATFQALVQARAVSDYHYNTINNGYKQGTIEHETYAKTIKELMERDQ